MIEVHHRGEALHRHEVRDGGSWQAEQTSDFLGIATSMTFSFTEVAFKIGAWHSTQATPDSAWIPCGNL